MCCSSAIYIYIYTHVHVYMCVGCVQRVIDWREIMELLLSRAVAAAATRTWFTASLFAVSERERKI